MDTKHITAVHYVHANDPIGRLMIQTAGDLWAGTGELPPWHENEYLRGQVEMISQSMRLITPWEVDYDEEEDKDRAAMLIEAASNDVLDAALKSLYSEHHDWCTKCEAITEYDGDECLGCGRLWGHDA